MKYCGKSLPVDLLGCGPTTGAEGYLNTAYFVGRVQAFVGRTDGGTSTLLRKNPTTSRDASYYLDSRAMVTNGEKLTFCAVNPRFAG